MGVCDFRDQFAVTNSVIRDKNEGMTVKASGLRGRSNRCGSQYSISTAAGFSPAKRAKCRFSLPGNSRPVPSSWRVHREPALSTWPPGAAIPGSHGLSRRAGLRKNRTPKAEVRWAGSPKSRGKMGRCGVSWRRSQSARRTPARQTDHPTVSAAGGPGSVFLAGCRRDALRRTRLRVPSLRHLRQ